MHGDCGVEIDAISLAATKEFAISGAAGDVQCWRSLPGSYNNQHWWAKTATRGTRMS
jgi:hypothetical protein